jgi:hypothetical protein
MYSLSSLTDFFREGVGLFGPEYLRDDALKQVVVEMFFSFCYLQILSSLTKSPRHPLYFIEATTITPKIASK